MVIRQVMQLPIGHRSDAKQDFPSGWDVGLALMTDWNQARERSVVEVETGGKKDSTSDGSWIDMTADYSIMAVDPSGRGQRRITVDSG